MNTNSNDGNKLTDEKKRTSPPTIGEAVKEAIDTGKEVMMQGPSDTEDLEDIKNIINSSVELNESSKEFDKGIALSVDQTDASKLEISANDESDKSLTEDKITVNLDKEDTKVETVTTIPADEDIDVEVKTEVKVPIDNKNKDVESDLKALVHSPNLTVEVPIDSSSRLSSSSSISSSSPQEESNKPNFYTEKNQQETSKGVSEIHDNLNKKIENFSGTIPSTIFENFDKTNMELTKTSKDVMDKYFEYQTQAINSFQSVFYALFENSSNIFWNSHIYCTNMQETYSKMATMCTENTIALGKMINDIANSNAGYFKNLFELS
jgi:hypothetical protein